MSDRMHQERIEHFLRRIPQGHRGTAFATELVTLIRDLAMTVDQLNTKLQTQSVAITSLEARLAQQPAAPDLQPIADAIDANTAAINAILPLPAQTPPATPSA